MIESFNSFFIFFSIFQNQNGDYDEISLSIGLKNIKNLHQKKYPFDNSYLIILKKTEIIMQFI